MNETEPTETESERPSDGLARTKQSTDSIFGEMIYHQQLTLNLIIYIIIAWVILSTITLAYYYSSKKVLNFVLVSGGAIGFSMIYIYYYYKIRREMFRIKILRAALRLATSREDAIKILKELFGDRLVS